MFIYHEVRGSFDKALVGRKEINWLKLIITEYQFSWEQIHFCYFSVFRLKEKRKRTEACLNQRTSKSI